MGQSSITARTFTVHAVEIVSVPQLLRSQEIKATSTTLVMNRRHAFKMPKILPSLVRIVFPNQDWFQW
ncbi:MAG: hypothetical protein CMM00_05010 [Rhodopirellula sp.]|nr:hypothetical protein [Rhodopirellula sp.]